MVFSWIFSGHLPIYLETSEGGNYEIVASKVQPGLMPDEFSKLSRIVVLDRDDPAIAFLQEECPLTNDEIKESCRDFSIEPLSEKLGFIVERAYILHSRKDATDITCLNLDI